MPCGAGTKRIRCVTPLDPANCSDDAFLGGMLQIFQPKKGYRAGIDAVLLAASIPAGAGEIALEAGAGVGVASLCLATRVSGVTIAALELQPELVALARDNVARNDRKQQIELFNGTVLDPPPAIATRQYDHFFCNPPFHGEEKGTKASDRQKELSNRGDEANFEDWLSFGTARLRPGGRLTLIHKAERLADIVAALSSKAGAIGIFPLWPRRGMPAKRVIVTAIKGSRSPLKLLSGLVLHEEGREFTHDAEEVLRHGAAISLE
ncbi:MAG: methyltransferase [Alphaproteobacteria bacterium]|nr:MAG: methyltransferase [Alphaproteobacteria bacterium]